MDDAPRFLNIPSVGDAAEVAGNNDVGEDSDDSEDGAGDSDDDEDGSDEDDEEEDDDEDEDGDNENGNDDNNGDDGGNADGSDGDGNNDGHNDNNGGSDATGGDSAVGDQGRDGGVRGEQGAQHDDERRGQDGTGESQHAPRQKTARDTAVHRIPVVSEPRATRNGRGSLATCGDVHPNPGPYLRFLQWNAAGLTDSKRNILIAHLADVDIALVQETHRQTLSLPGFDVYHAAFPRDPNSRGSQNRGGACIIVRRGINVHISSPSTSTTKDMQWISLTLHLGEAATPLEIASVYVRPDCPLYARDLPALGPRAAFVGGDVNAHNIWWDELIPEDARGRNVVANWLIDHNMAIANDPTVPTRPRPRVASQAASSPDITAFSGCDVLGWESRPTPDSDHALIRCTVAIGPLDGPPPQTHQRVRHRPAWTFGRADWPLFKRTVERSLARHPPRNIDTAYGQLTDALLSAASASIPRGCYAYVHPIHSIMRSEEVIRADAALERAGTDAERVAASAARQQTISDLLRAAYHQHVGELDPNNKETWAFVKSLGKAPPPCAAAVRMGDGETTTDKQKAREFARKYAMVSSGGRIPTRVRVRRGTPLYQVTRTELNTALKALKRGRAPGSRNESCRHA
eukprot:PhM_4_TR11636/c8_g2_i1/m.6205